MVATPMAPPKPAQPNPDISAARLIARAWDDETRTEYITCTIPSRQDSDTRYTLHGHSHARDAVCSCLGFQRWHRCCHAAAFPLILAELEKQYYLGYSVRALTDLLDYFERIPDILSTDQRLRRDGIAAALAAKGVDYRATRTLAERARVVARGKAAAGELFGE